MAGIGLANLVGGIASRNAGTPRYGILLICILTLPFALATILSPVPFLFLIGLQTPIYTAGMIFLLLENHKILLELHHSERNNRQMAHHDLLTGLPNRALNLKLFSELLDGPWPKAGSPASKLTVFCLDLDGFKGVNDRFGHAAGDAVLVAVADRLRASVRDGDYVCRLGGDEFVILLPNITDGEAAAVARRIISRISVPFEFAPTARVGASIGLASAPRDGITAIAERRRPRHVRGQTPRQRRIRDSHPRCRRGDACSDGEGTCAGLLKRLRASVLIQSEPIML
jgi:diguanylate cyclase (GGDEF)-like protein